MVRLIKLLTFTLLSSFCLSTNTVAQTEITQEMINAAQLKIDKACPARWQNVSEKLVIPTDASEDIWADATDRATFVTYITQVIADSGSSADPQVLTDDVATIAAECATKRTGLLDLLLIKEPNDVILGMRALKSTLDQQGAFSRDGSAQSLAAKSCKEIKGGYSDSVDGVYWLDFDGGNTDNAVEAYCDMTTDGGGWTFVAFLTDDKRMDDNGGSNSAKRFFEEPVGVYESSRIATTDHYSLGVLPQMDDTEMMLVGDSPDPLSSKQLKSFIRFKYSKNAPAFNYGPISCTPSSFKYSIVVEPLESDFYAGVFRSYCSDVYWLPEGVTLAGGSYYLMAFYFTYKGMWVGNYAAGNSSGKYNVDVWVYVR